MEIGFAGLGAMGRAIAGRLLGAQHAVLGWNRSACGCAALVGKGMRLAGSLQELAGCDILFSMLADDGAVRGVFGESGLLEKLRPGSVHVNMATVSAGLAREMAARHGKQGIAYVASPVLGRPDAAAEGRLHLLVAGAQEAVGRVRPLLEVIGQRVWFFGAQPEQANVVKIAANMMLASAIEAMGETAALVTGYGIAKDAYLDMLANTLFAAPAYKVYGPMIAQGAFAPAGFRVGLGLKDAKLALEAGEEARVPLPLAAIVRDNLLDCLAHGEGDLDWSALVKAQARRAGH